jgi:cell pole-organizing protein PopZ
MSQPAKLQEPTMEEILASIRRIIADDDASKPAKAPETAAPPKPPAAAAPSRPMPPATPAKSATSPPPTARPAAPVVANSQDAIDAMLAELDGPPNAAPQPAATQPGATAADVLDLTEAMAEPSPSPGPAPTFRTIDGTSDVVFSTKPEPPPDRALISNETIAAVDSAFNTLAHTVIGQNARTLEDLVREMLRPMLKSWLDDNLPSMVERIVRAEIERVSRGRP